MQNHTDNLLQEKSRTGESAALRTGRFDGEHSAGREEDRKKRRADEGEEIDTGAEGRERHAHAGQRCAREAVGCLGSPGRRGEDERE